MDASFIPLRQILDQMLAHMGEELVDDDAGVRSHIYECTIESPIELDVPRDADGVLHLGATPPLYYVDTTFRPSFHRITFTAFVE
ncbi:hypothetical protein AWB81_07015 [Caballeronia arationis]|uniref:hypothetical protein n=1 Tax=Caballeronia arationis TaxID=1777142 RepID=UPI00074C2EEF|nr:hypothetical protein [Caballeronia arationis]SAL05095.1 hypothetical protein AWB81_07015 [Caballeronia arationis]